jgi:hypothetical protein
MWSCRPEHWENIANNPSKPDRFFGVCFAVEFSDEVSSLRTGRSNGPNTFFVAKEPDNKKRLENRNFRGEQLREVSSKCGMHSSFPKSRLRLVSTSADFPATPAVVWETLLFYEEVSAPAPFFLRWLLPVPLGTAGSKSTVGSEVRCRYDGGHLLKRVSAIVEMRRFAFDVIEQNLPLHSVRVLAGEYNLHAVAPARTRVTLSTRYASPHRPDWVYARFEAAVCHCFHRHLLGAMRQNLVADVLASAAA